MVCLTALFWSKVVAAPETISAVTDESDVELVQLMVSLRNYYSQKQSDSADQEIDSTHGFASRPLLAKRVRVC